MFFMNDEKNFKLNNKDNSSAPKQKEFLN